MRMRKKKHGAERLSALSHIVCNKPEKPYDNAFGCFGRGGQLHLEIGCGKGGFACGMAQKYPEINFFAFEKILDVIVAAAEKAECCKNERITDNLRFAIGDAKDITEWFMPSSVDVLYLNFSDPWPKKKHAKRRLTSREFLISFLELIKDGGMLKFKTDNRALFDFTLSELSEIGVEIADLTFDLHNSVYNEDNVMTEYERNFSEKGFPINMLTVKVKKQSKGYESAVGGG